MKAMFGVKNLINKSRLDNRGVKTYSDSIVFVPYLC